MKRVIWPHLVAVAASRCSITMQHAYRGAWTDKEIKPDPTTQKKSVQIAAPVLDGGKAAGVNHGAVEVQ